jgi:hypothetical protein
MGQVFNTTRGGHSELEVLAAGQYYIHGTTQQYFIFIIIITAVLLFSQIDLNSMTRHT